MPVPPFARRLAFGVAAWVLAAAPHALEAQAKPGCWNALGRLSSYGSPDQVRQLQQMLHSTKTSACPRVGFSYAASGRAGLVAYDREGGVIVRRNRFGGEAAQTETWINATEAAVLRDDPDDGFDSGTYQRPREGWLPMPRALRDFVRRHGAALGA